MNGDGDGVGVSFNDSSHSFEIATEWQLYFGTVADSKLFEKLLLVKLHY